MFKYPHILRNGEQADAAKVNANFAALAQYINENLQTDMNLKLFCVLPLLSSGQFIITDLGWTLVFYFEAKKPCKLMALQVYSHTPFNDPVTYKIKQWTTGGASSQAQFPTAANNPMGWHQLVPVVGHLAAGVKYAVSVRLSIPVIGGTLFGTCLVIEQETEA